MMKTIDKGMMMGGLVENIILVLILQPQQALVLQQQVVDQRQQVQAVRFKLIFFLFLNFCYKVH
jgi:hypothetical protein